MFLVQNVLHSTIKVYLSALCSLYIRQGFPDPLVNCLQLQQVLRGIIRTQGDTSLRLPVTDDIMVAIFRALDLRLLEHCMFWAACNLAYFGFPHSAEFTVLNLGSFSPTIHLDGADITVHSDTSPSCLRIRIKASKTDLFCKGCFMYIGKGEFPLCVIHSLLAYLSLRGSDPGPLFLFCDGWLLTHAILSSWLHDILTAVGIHSKFSSHIFHIGVATVAARNGILYHQIQALGQWTSTAYLSYFCIPADLLLQFSKQLAS